MSIEIIEKYSNENEIFCQNLNNLKSKYKYSLPSYWTRNLWKWTSTLATLDVIQKIAIRLIENQTFCDWLPWLNGPSKSVSALYPFLFFNSIECKKVHTEKMQPYRSCIAQKKKRVNKRKGECACTGREFKFLEVLEINLFAGSAFLQFEHEGVASKLWRKFILFYI